MVDMTSMNTYLSLNAQLTANGVIMSLYLLA